MTECIHGLDRELCDICNPKKAPEKPAVKRAAPARAARPAPLKARAARRLHVVLSLDDLADALAEGSLADPIYFVGPEELAWAERRRAADATQQVVLVVASALSLRCQTTSSARICRTVVMLREMMAVQAQCMSRRRAVRTCIADSSLTTTITSGPST